MQKLLWAALGLAVMLPANAEVGPCNAYGPNEHKSPVTAETPLSLNSVLSEIRLASPEVRPRDSKFKPGRLTRLKRGGV